MKSIDRSTLAGALFLILLGVVFLVFNFVDLKIAQTWPMIFLILAAFFFIPALIWPDARRGLAGLYIPGSILLVLGIIFFYNTLTNDWVSWAYAWTLIPGSVGLGLMLGSWIGKWSDGGAKVGAWMLGISLLVFALFGAIFGTIVLRIAGPVMLLLGGIYFMARSFGHSQPQA